MQRANRETSENAHLPALDLISRLCRTLETEGISYCHWKSNESLDRSASGENDLDLLISRRDAQRFAAVLRRLGFKQALLSPSKELPGVFHAYALDEASQKLVHVHAHYQLLVGDDMTKNYRIPIEGPYLASSVQGPVFRVPAPEFEFAVFLVRMILKHATWDAIVSFQGSPSASEKRELESLARQVDLARMQALMRDHLPFVESSLWERCLHALRPGISVWRRLGAARRLQAALAGHGRRPRSADTWLRMWRRGLIFVRRYVLRLASPRKRLDSGGALIAFVGGDGAGKTTAVEELSAWLSRDFDVHKVHLGKPSRSLASALSRAMWESGRALHRSPVQGGATLRAVKSGPIGFGGFARLVWEVMKARDRYGDYVRARRLASNGAIVICDRYPLPQIRLMDGAGATRLVDHPNRLVRSLARLEKRYYDRILYPDVLIVLRVHPDLAVERKRDEEGEAFVRPRSEEIWRLDWRGTPAIVVDAGRPRAEVLSELKSLVWSRL